MYGCGRACTHSRAARVRSRSQGVVPFYLCPPRRYVYYAPGRQQERTQATSPFDSFWYCYLEPCGLEKEQVASWFEARRAPPLARSLASGRARWFRRRDL